MQRKSLLLPKNAEKDEEKKFVVDDFSGELSGIRANVVYQRSYTLWYTAIFTPKTTFKIYWDFLVIILSVWNAI